MAEADDYDFSVTRNSLRVVDSEDSLSGGPSPTRTPYHEKEEDGESSSGVLDSSEPPTQFPSSSSSSSSTMIPQRMRFTLTDSMFFPTSTSSSSSSSNAPATLSSYSFPLPSLDAHFSTLYCPPLTYFTSQSDPTSFSHHPSSDSSHSIAATAAGQPISSSPFNNASSESNSSHHVMDSTSSTHEPSATSLPTTTTTTTASSSSSSHASLLSTNFAYFRQLPSVRAEIGHEPAQRECSSYLFLAQQRYFVALLEHTMYLFESDQSDFPLRIIPLGADTFVECLDPSTLTFSLMTGSSQQGLLTFRAASAETTARWVQTLLDVELDSLTHVPCARVMTLRDRVRRHMQDDAASLQESADELVRAHGEPVFRSIVKKVSSVHQY